MKKSVSILAILSVFSFTSCLKKETGEKDKIKTAHWIIGNWENKSSDGVLTENWKKLNDSTFSASCFFIKEKDTIHQENITLSQKGENLTYAAAIKGQNEDKTIAFPAALSTEKQLVFENPKHDYPQKITYTKGENNTLTAEISGNLQGKWTTEQFVMTKK